MYLSLHRLQLIMYESTYYIVVFSIDFFVPKFFERSDISQNTKISIEIPTKPKVSKDLLIFEEKKEISKSQKNTDDKTSASKRNDYYLQIAVLSNQHKAFEIIEKFNRKGINVFYENINRWVFQGIYNMINKILTSIIFCCSNFIFTYFKIISF